jgi:hypothetical protein
MNCEPHSTILAQLTFHRAESVWIAAIQRVSNKISVILLNGISEKLNDNPVF